MLQKLQQFRRNYHLRNSGIRRFGPKISFEFEAGPYLVKTASTREELVCCFRLRNEVFNKEFRGVDNLVYDFDEFDCKSDHIIIVNKDDQKVVGTYRLNSTLFSNEFYTQQEFHLKDLKSLPGPVLELGRACIHRDHRRGIVISLLWKGIAEYMNLSEAKTLLGCSSVKVNQAREAALLFNYLYFEGYVTSDLGITPTPAYTISQFSVWSEYFRENFSEALAQEAQDLVPSLLKSYLKLGAKIISEPAFDEEFDCIDMLTVLSREQLILTAGKKFGIRS